MSVVRQSVLVIMLVACGDTDDHAQGSDAPVDADVADTADAADAVATDTHGDATDSGEVGDVAFLVALIESTSASGGDRYGFVTAGRLWEESTVGGITVGDCTFYPASPPPFCDPACEPGTVCVADDTCDPPLTPLGSGDITVTGAKVAISLHPETQYIYYTPTLTPEPVDGDLFESGAALVATSTGGNVPAFEIGVAGVADLVTTLACPPPLTIGASLAVTWTPGDGQAVHLDLESGNHGGQFARIACDTSDTGSLVVDATLIDLYLASSRPIDLWRLVRGNRSVAGGVRFDAASQISCRW